MSAAVSGLPDAAPKAIPEDLRLLSVVVPVYGSPASLEPLRDLVAQVAEQLGVAFELILVDDRCPLGSWAVVERMAKADARVVGVRLARNFGQHAAIQAGLSRVRGDWVAVMDCDLQDRPEELPALLAKAAEGYDVVRAERNERRDSGLRVLFSALFYRLLGYLTDTPFRASVANFGVYRRKVIDTITSWPEDTKYFPAIVNWVGFEQAHVAVEHGERFAGPSSYTFRKLLRLAVQVVVGFSDKPLRLIVSGGAIIAGASFVISAVSVILALAGAVSVEGWTSLILSIWFLGGSVLVAIGITGLYVGRILVETKGRPPFIIDRIVSDAVPDRARRE